MKTLKIWSLFLLFSTLFFSCQKEYSLEGVVTPAGTWQFNDAAHLYAGNIDTAYIETAGTTKTLNLIGKSADGKQNFNLRMIGTDSIKVGTYKASLFETDFQYDTQAKTIYLADGIIVGSGEFSVTISAIGNNSVTGTFDGDAEDSTGAIKPLTLGKFTARVNLAGNGTGGGGGGTAIGTLGAAAGVCTPITTGGTFTQGISLTSTNTASVQVTVSTIGTYTISTNSVNGVSFSKAGTFTTVGAQNVILVGSGTPVASGNQTFTVTFGTSTCTFVINFLPGTPPPATDYFPTTAGSNWGYGNTADATDSFYVAATSTTKSIGGNTYNAFTYDVVPNSSNPDSLFYRKSAGNYYEIFDAEELIGLDAGTANPKNLEYIFLKESANVNDTWQSGTVTGMYQGTPVSFYVKMTLLAKAVSATSGVVTSTDVMKVKYDYYLSTTGVPAFIFFSEERWFARGKGMIYNSFDDQSGAPAVVYKVGRIVVL